MLMLVIESNAHQIEDEDEEEHGHDYEVASTECFATFPAREARWPRVDLPTWCRNCRSQISE